MQRRDAILGLGAALLFPATPALAAPTVLSGNVEGLLVRKARRQLILVGSRKVLKRYSVALGFEPVGHKQRQGDGRTPEGNYSISLRNPYSQFHLSLKVSYPSREDRIAAARRGVSPGGDIFIHGVQNGLRRAPPGDWTRGCIAVTDPEMEELWEAVPLGCPITIEA
jgi:murein L,D-transpeptidase YafK